MSRNTIVKTKKMIQEKIEEMGYGVFLIMVAVTIIMAFAYNLLIKNLFLSVLSIGMAIFGCYYLFKYISEDEEPLELMEGEDLLLRTLDRGVVLFPRKKGKFLGKTGHKDVSLYLTSKRILARDSSGFVLNVPVSSIRSRGVEKKLGSNYIRVTFLDKGGERDVLLFVGDTKLWMEKLGEQVGQDEDEFLMDAQKVKDSI